MVNQPCKLSLTSLRGRIISSTPWLQVKVRGRGLSLRPVGCTPALSVTQKCRCNCGCGLWRYVSVICLCFCRYITRSTVCPTSNSLRHTFSILRTHTAERVFSISGPTTAWNSILLPIIPFIRQRNCIKCSHSIADIDISD